MDISVIIPTYKPGDYLWQCLDSIKNQTLPSNLFEIIIVLNGSCEPWKSTIENYIGVNFKDNNTRFIQTDNPGVSNARNIALDIAQGDYIAFIDDDDYVSPDYLKILLDYANKNVVPVAYPYAFQDGVLDKQVYCSMNKTYEKYISKRECSLVGAKSFFSGPCMKLIHKSIIRKHRFDVNLKVGEDTTFMFAVSDQIKSVAFVPSKAIYYRRIRRGSAITTRRSVKEKVKSNIHQLSVYFKLYIGNISGYNFFFFISRCGGCIKGMLC